VGFLTIGLVIFVWRADPRRWMLRLAFVALGAVVLQGVLGGLTVLFFLPAPISIGHAGLAQLFVCLTVSIALFTSRGWREAPRPRVDDPLLRQGLTALTALIYAQILIGATVRHLGAGLAIPDFPLAFGHLLPPAWPLPVAIHFTHRMVGLLIAIVVIATAAHIWRHHARRSELTRPAWTLLGLVVLQITLGGLVVLSARQPVINTMHVANGAAVLATSLVLTLRAYRVRFE
jgi:cytochrome c oxidase assembly protein subunit 15